MPVQRSRRFSSEPARPSYSWKRNGFEAIRFCRRTPFIRRALTFSTRWVSATPFGPSHRRHHRAAAKERNHCRLPVSRGESRYCPRRTRLDGLLQDAAASAGVEVLDGTRVISLVRDGDRVVGLRAADRRVRSVCSARVWSWGRRPPLHSRTPSQAEEYLGYDAPRAMFWGYWNAPRSGEPILPIDSGCTGEYRWAHPSDLSDGSRSASDRQSARGRAGHRVAHRS